MANHSGAHMLNDVLCMVGHARCGTARRMLEEESFFATLGPEKTQQFIRRVVDLGFDQDCQSYEILNGIGPRLGICIVCSCRADDLDDGWCPDCRADLAREQ